MAMTFTFGDVDYPHRIGDPDCKEGWCSTHSGYPHPCTEPDCEGLVHANFGDEDYECNYWLYTKCDRCGESE